MQELPDGYNELLGAADENHGFWKVLSECFTNHTMGAKNCTGPDNETALNTALTKLSKYDMFVLEKLLVANHGNMSNDVLKKGFDPGRWHKNTKKRYKKDQFSKTVLQQDRFVEEFCQNVEVCNAEQIHREISKLVSQIVFLVKGWVEAFLVVFLL